MVLTAASCSKHGDGMMDEVAFSVSGVGVDAFVDTRVTVVDASSLNFSGIHVSATTGSAGSESAEWTNVLFTKVGSYFTGGQYWPDTNADPFHFYASNQALTFTAAGATVSAVNTSDVVCAYMPSPTFKGVNTLVFDHIFARLGEVTFSAAPDFTVSGISVTIVPQTGGTYNLRTGYGQTDGTGWSGVTAGSATAITNSTPGTKVNDFYLVPGTYTITATWTVTSGDFSKTYSNKTYDVDLVAGKVNTITAVLGSDAEDIKFTAEVEPWGALAIAAGEFPVADPVYTFGGLMISSGPLKYSGGTFVLEDDWNHDSYNSIYGLNEGSYVFNWEQLGKYFDSSGSSFSITNRVSIDNANKIVWGGYNDWRLPTVTELQTIVTTLVATRPGSTVNGAANKHYALIRLTGVSHGGTSTPYGLLLFPDNCTITGKSLSGIDNTTITSNVTESELNIFLQQGCSFLPGSGYLSSNYYGDSWSTDCGGYYSSTYYNYQNNYHYCYRLYFSSYPSVSVSSGSGNALYYSVRLVRNAE